MVAWPSELSASFVVNHPLMMLGLHLWAPDLKSLLQVGTPLPHGPGEDSKEIKKSVVAQKVAISLPFKSEWVR